VYLFVMEPICMIMARSSFARSKTWNRSLQQPVEFLLVALSTICQSVVSPVDLLLARPSRALFRDLIFFLQQCDL